MKQILTITQVKQALHKLAEQKNRPSYEVCTAKEVKMAFELGLDHPLIEELRGLIEFKPVVAEVVRTHRVSRANRPPEISGTRSRSRLQQTPHLRHG